ncbi:MAG: alpha/beta fold hydrolase [Proteobacteria bacterium]|nr:alpha/beta fold hydrolase [Pseudomonadota bacterium]
MKLVFNDLSFSFQLLHAISYTPYGGADIGECLAIANKIKEGDFESWYENWDIAATRLQNYANEAFEKKQFYSARNAYLRASNYHRTSGFFLNENTDDFRFMAAWKKSCDLFTKAMSLYSYNFEIINIPFEEGTLPGYFVSPDNSGTPRPTLIALTGFDGTKEELFLQSGFEALSRGYNFLCFEGPGQGAVVREQKLYFRHDWEKIVTPIVDFAHARSEVDSKRIALMGVSYGGYLAARAAAFEPRLAALIANDGLYDLYEATMAYSEKSAELRQSVQTSLPTTVRWALAQAKWVFQASPEEYIEKLKKYTLKEVASKISCPTLICEAENDHFFKGQPEKIFDALTCQKSYIRFTEEEGAGEHCHVGALALFNARIFDWLNNTLRHT